MDDDACVGAHFVSSDDDSNPTRNFTNGVNRNTNKLVESSSNSVP